jgi:hypothetical protein
MADEDNKVCAEMIASKFVAQIEAEYTADTESAYLQLAQLFDPRVNFRTPSAEAVKKLLNESAKTFRADVGQARNRRPNTGSFDDLSDEEEVRDPLDTDIDTFRRKILPSIRNRISADGAPLVYEYYGGCDRQQDIDVFKFYGEWAQHIPVLFPIILHILSHRCVSTTPETVFSVGGYVLNDYRTSMTPERAEGAILAASNYKLSKRKSAAVIPSLPDIGEFSEDELFMYIDGFEEERPNDHQDNVEHDNILAAVYDSDSDDDEDFVDMDD